MPYDNIIVQGVEYKFSTFSISDGAFGSCFYFATGFHGLTNVALFIYLFITFLIKFSYRTYYSIKEFF